MLKKANKYDLNEINEKLALYDENEKDINLHHKKNRIFCR